MGDLSQNFSRVEFQCPCCEFATVDAQLVKLLERVRARFGNPIVITSGARCRKRNREIGGAKFSKHLFGIAADIQVKGVEPKQVYAFIDSLLDGHEFPPGGLGLYSSWVHVDVRAQKARW